MKYHNIAPKSIFIAILAALLLFSFSSIPTNAQSSSSNYNGNACVIFGTNAKTILGQVFGTAEPCRGKLNRKLILQSVL